MFFTTFCCDEILQLCILLWYCGVFFCNLPNLYLSTFQVGTASLETCTTIEPRVCFSNTSPISHLLRVCCCGCCHVTCQFFCAVYDVSSVNGKKIGSCRQCTLQSGFGRAQNLSDQWLFLHAQLSQLSPLHFVVCFVSHTILALFGHGIFKDVRLDAPVSRMTASARFWSASAKQSVTFCLIKTQGCTQCVSVSDEQPTQQLLLKANSFNVHRTTY